MTKVNKEAKEGLISAIYGFIDDYFKIRNKKKTPRLIIGPWNDYNYFSCVLGYK